MTWANVELRAHLVSASNPTIATDSAACVTIKGEEVSGIPLPALLPFVADVSRPGYFAFSSLVRYSAHCDLPQLSRMRLPPIGKPCIFSMALSASGFLTNCTKPQCLPTGTLTCNRFWLVSVSFSAGHENSHSGFRQMGQKRSSVSLLKSTATNHQRKQLYCKGQTT